MTISPHRKTTSARIGIALCVLGICGALAYLTITSATGMRPPLAVAIAVAMGMGVLVCVGIVLALDLLDREYSNAEIRADRETSTLSFTPPPLEPLERARPRLTRIK